MRKTFVLLAICALASLGLVACGGSSDSSSSSTAATSSSSTSTSAGGGGGGLPLAADPSQLAYDTTSLSAPAGDVTIDFNNPGATGHDVCVRSSSGDELGCSDIVSSDSTTLDAGNLKAGDYTFYCSVDSHEQAGMTGTLKVQ